MWLIRKLFKLNVFPLAAIIGYKLHPTLNQSNIHHGDNSVIIPKKSV